MKQLRELVAISKFYGNNKDYVIAGGGNTSYKNKEYIWVKASGTSLGSIKVKDLAKLNRKRLEVISNKKYSNNSTEREEEVKCDLADATITKDKRPSVETSIHDVIDYPFVIHTHPTLVNGLMCSKNVKSELKKLFGEDAFYISYTDPGYTLFKKISKGLVRFEKKFGRQPKIIWLQNHGVFVAGNSVQEIEELYAAISKSLMKHWGKEKIIFKSMPYPINSDLFDKIKKVLNDEGAFVIDCRNDDLIINVLQNNNTIKAVSGPFIPDQIVYCKSEYVFINNSDEHSILRDTKKKVKKYFKKYSYLPKVLFIKGLGMITIGETISECNIIADIFEDAIKIAAISESFGGPHPMTKRQIDFIENWEVENYRRKMAGTSLY